MKLLAWSLIPAIIGTLIFLFTPSLLWLIDKMFSRLLEQKLFRPVWYLPGILATLLCWGLYALSQR